MGLSFIGLYAISVTRTGAAVSVQRLIETISLNYLILILAVIFIVGILDFFWTIFLAKKSCKILKKINYTRLSIFILIFISAVVLTFSGFLGFLVFLISTSTGIFGILSGTKRINMMGCLLIPTILIYLV